MPVSLKWSIFVMQSWIKGIIIDNDDEYHLNSYCVNFEDQSVLVCAEKRFKDRRLAKAGVVEQKELFISLGIESSNDLRSFGKVILWLHLKSPKIEIFFIAKNSNLSMVGHCILLQALIKVIIMSISIVCILTVMSLNVVIAELRSIQIASIKIPFCFFLAFSFIIVVISSSLDNSALNSSTCITLGKLHVFIQFTSFNY